MFDFIIGNVPWDDEVDKIFLIKCKTEILAPYGTMALITSASLLRGGGSKNRQLRSILINSGNINKIYTYPADVFINPITQKPIKAIGSCLLYNNGSTQTQPTLIRYFGNTTFETKTNISERDGVILYLGDRGKQLWDICTTNVKKIPLCKYIPSDKPKIHFNSKLDLNYFGSSKPLGTITGKKILTGVQIDLDGNNYWHPQLKPNSNRLQDDNAAKRYMLEFEYNQEQLAKNAYYHLSMRLSGLLLGMSNTISHVNKRSLGELPYDILQGKYDSIEEYELAYYKSKKLSHEMIEWIEVVGKNNGNVDNLKGDNTVYEICRSIDRVKQTGEVFTPVRYIDDIIDDMYMAGMCNQGKRTLEPSCGDGNFVVAIIHKKLECGITKTSALKTTYAIDLMKDNVELCRKRVLELVGNTPEYSSIVKSNIVQADSLNGWDFTNWERKETQEECINSLLEM